MLDSLGSIILISLFWLVSIGLVVTAGIGTVIAYELCRRYVLDKDATPLDVARKAWQQSWKQATVVGLLAVALAALAVLTVSFIPTLGLGNVLVPLLVTAFFLMIVLFWCLPLVARFENPTGRQLRNGFTLALATPSHTFLLAIAAMLVGFALWNFAPAVFVLPGAILLWWCSLLERFFVDRGFVTPLGAQASEEPEASEE